MVEGLEQGHTALDLTTGLGVEPGPMPLARLRCRATDSDIGIS